LGDTSVFTDLRPARPGTTTRARISRAAARSGARGSMARWGREAAAACQLRHTSSATLTVAVDEETKNHEQGSSGDTAVELMRGVRRGGRDASGTALGAGSGARVYRRAVRVAMLA
jgi:hypothetical protein